MVYASFPSCFPNASGSFSSVSLSDEIEYVPPQTSGVGCGALNLPTSGCWHFEYQQLVLILPIRAESYQGVLPWWPVYTDRDRPLFDQGDPESWNLMFHDSNIFFAHL